MAVRRKGRSVAYYLTILHPEITEMKTKICPEDFLDHDMA
jgi:hypothetical protein